MSREELQRGGVFGGTLYVIVILMILGAMSFMMIGGNVPSNRAPRSGQAVVIIPPPPQSAKNNLQLLTFTGVTPTPPVVNCQGSQFNTEQEILVGTDPAPKGAINAAGTIRVWVNDEGAPYIAPNAVVDPSTGNVTNDGDVTAVDNGTDGNGNYLWVPSLYVITDQTKNANGAYCDAHTAGCTPHFPNIVKGTFSNSPLDARGGFRHGGGVQGPPIDSYKGFENGPDYSEGTELAEMFTAEYIWKVSDLGLSTGNHTAQFVIHDGDRNLAINCIDINI